MFFFPIIVVLSVQTQGICLFPRLALNVPSSCLSIPSASVITTTTPLHLMSSKPDEPASTETNQPIMDHRTIKQKQGMWMHLSQQNRRTGQGKHNDIYNWIL